MRRAAWMAVCLLAPSASRAQELLAQRTERYLVRYADGRTEHQEVSWAARLDAQRWETGGPAMPLQLHFVDDRQCNWRITGFVERRQGVMDAGSVYQRSSSPPKILTTSTVSAGADAYKVQTARGQGCSAAEERYRATVERARKQTLSDFTARLEPDRKMVLEEMRRRSGVRSVEVETPSRRERP